MFQLRWPPAGYGQVLIDCGPTLPAVSRWVVGLATGLVLACVPVYAFAGEPFGAILALILVAPFATPLFLLTLPRHTLLCEGGVAAASGRAKWSDVMDWETYDNGRCLSVVIRQSAPFGVEEHTVETRLKKNRDAAIALLRERVPNGRVLP